MTATLQGLIRNSGIDSVASITPIANIAALRALTTSTGIDNPKVVYLDGYYTEGDGGQGFFECIPGGTPTSASFLGDGGATYINSDSAMSGYINIGDLASGAGIANNSFILSQASGPTGGLGGYYTLTLSSAAVGTPMTTTSDNGATCIVDGSGRRWKRIWDGSHFQAAWAGILTTNTDNGQLLGRCPKFCEVWFGPGVYQFTTYPSQTDFQNVWWRGNLTIWNCTGPIGSNTPNTASDIAFNWNWSAYLYHEDVNEGHYYSNSAGTSDMASAGNSPIEGIGIVCTGNGDHGVGVRFGSSDLYPFTAPNFVQPRNFSVGGFYQQIGHGIPYNIYLTGYDQCVFKGGGIGLYYDNNPSSNSGENMTCRRSDFNQMQDGIQLFSAQRWCFNNCSVDYNVRGAYCSNQYTVWQSCYFETNSTVTTFELLAVDQNATIVFDSGTNILMLPSNSGDLIAFDGASNSKGMMVHFDKTAYVDQNPNKQFIQSQSGLQIYGSVIGYNGNNFPMCVSPNQCIQPDWNFASGGMTLYPGSVGCTNQTSVVHGSQTNAVALNGNATLQFATMDVKPGELIFVSLFDELAGIVNTLSGNMVFTTSDTSPVTVATTAFSVNPSVVNWHASDQPLAPNWTTTPRSWGQQQFVFRVPIGASKMTGNLSILGATTLYPPSTGPSIVLTNNDLTATATAAAASLTKATTSELTGLFYDEITVGQASGLSVGLANSFAFVNAALGVDTNSLAYAPSGTVSINGSTIGTAATFANTNVIGRCWDATNAKIYFRVNGGNWNNNGSANPVTNVGGFSTATLAAGVPYFPAIGTSATGAAATDNFGATAYTQTPPVGAGNFASTSTYYVSELAVYHQ